MAKWLALLNFGSQGQGFKSSWRQNSAHDCVALYCTEFFIIILPFSQYDLSNVERDVKHQIIIINPSSCSSRQGAFFHLIFFLFLQENICCGTSNGNPQHMFSWRNKKNITLISPFIWSFVQTKSGLHSEMQSDSECPALDPSQYLMMSANRNQIRPRGYKTFFMLNSTEHEICLANKSLITNNCKFFLVKHS